MALDGFHRERISGRDDYPPILVHGRSLVSGRSYACAKVSGCDQISERSTVVRRRNRSDGNVDENGTVAEGYQGVGENILTNPARNSLSGFCTCVVQQGDEFVAAVTKKNISDLSCNGMACYMAKNFVASVAPVSVIDLRQPDNIDEQQRELGTVREAFDAR